MSSDSNYCNISLHVHFHKHFEKMYNDNLNECPSVQSCTHIDYKLTVSANLNLGSKQSVIGIEFYKPVVKYYIEEISYDFQSLIGEVGGTMGLTVGLSFLSIVEWILDLFKKYKIWWLCTINNLCQLSNIPALFSNLSKGTTFFKLSLMLHMNNWKGDFWFSVEFVNGFTVKYWYLFYTVLCFK